MIAKRVSINVFGKISDKLYSGYINTDVKCSKSAYILTRRPIEEEVNGIVVAVITIADKHEERLVVASVGEVFYEPEIRAELSRLNNINISKITCLYEKSCGAIIVNRADRQIKILLVKNHNAKHWSFPKGHIEYGESEEHTAIREIKEETNLDVTICKGFKEETIYCPHGKIKKKVVFFLADSKNTNVKVQESEIASYQWVYPDKAHKLCTYENDHKLIDKAVEFFS